MDHKGEIKAQDELGNESSWAENTQQCGFKSYMCVSARAHACKHACVPQHACVLVRGQLEGVNSLLPMCEFKKLNSSHRA